MKSPCFTINRVSFQCLKSHCFTMTRGQNKKNQLEKGMVFNSQNNDGYPLLMALTLPVAALVARLHHPELTAIEGLTNSGEHKHKWTGKRSLFRYSLYIILSYFIKKTSVINSAVHYLVGSFKTVTVKEIQHKHGNTTRSPRRCI